MNRRAQALGRMARGVHKQISAKERQRRKNWMRKLRKRDLQKLKPAVKPSA